MNLDLEGYLERMALTEKAFFSMAYRFVHQRDADMTHDVLTYQVGGIVPEYVKTFVEELNNGGHNIRRS